MSKARSPEYPAIGLREAIERVKLVYNEDYTNTLPRELIAKHMGYSGISGASLTVLSSLSKYGLLAGRSDETRVSPLAVEIIAHSPGTAERIAAIKKAASLPELFNSFEEKWPNGRGSDAAIRAWLLTQGFIPAAADTAIRAYRETKKLVEEESKGYDFSVESAEHSAMQSTINAEDVIPKPMPPLRETLPRSPSSHAQEKVRVIDAERVVFTEESQPQQYVKVIASGDVDEILLDAIEDYVKRQKKRLGLTASKKEDPAN